MKVEYSTGDIVIITDNNGNKSYIDFSEIPMLNVRLYEALNYAVNSQELWRETAKLSEEYDVWGKNN